MNYYYFITEKEKQVSCKALSVRGWEEMNQLYKGKCLNVEFEFRVSLLNKYDGKSFKKKCGASLHFCINSGPIIQYSSTYTFIGQIVTGHTRYVHLYHTLQLRVPFDDQFS